MSEDVERVYTINLGKALISQSQHRSVRAINMIREFARHHMKVETIKIEEDLAHEIWARGVRRPPRKVRVRMQKTDEEHVIVSRYDEDVDLDETVEVDTVDKTTVDESVTENSEEQDTTGDKLATVEEEEEQDEKQEEEEEQDEKQEEEEKQDEKQEVARLGRRSAV